MKPPAIYNLYFEIENIEIRTTTWNTGLGVYYIECDASLPNVILAPDYTRAIWYQAPSIPRLVLLKPDWKRDPAASDTVWPFIFKLLVHHILFCRKASTSVGSLL